MPEAPPPLALLVLGWLEVFVPVGGGAEWAAAWNGFISGCSASMAALVAAGAIRNILALRSGERLRRQYIKTHDERTQQIFCRAGLTSYWFEVMGRLLAAVIAGYFSMAVSLACLGCLVYVCLTRLVLKLHYCRAL